jgi:hypothetical protein
MKLMKKKIKVKNTLSFTSPEKEFFFSPEKEFFYIYDVITSPAKEKRSTYHYSCEVVSSRPVGGTVFRSGGGSPR